MEKTKIQSPNVQVALFKRKEYWIAYCPALKLYGYSNVKKEEALKDFEAAVDTFIHVHTSLNSLDRVLLNLGWTSKDCSFVAPNFNIGLLEDVENEIVKERKITPKDSESRWVAIDIITDIIISEGKTPEEATEKANKTGQTFSLMFVPKAGQSYIL